MGLRLVTAEGCTEGLGLFELLNSVTADSSLAVSLSIWSCRVASCPTVWRTAATLCAIWCTSANSRAVGAFGATASEAESTDLTTVQPSHWIELAIICLV